MSKRKQVILVVTTNSVLFNSEVQDQSYSDNRVDLGNYLTPAEILDDGWKLLGPPRAYTEKHGEEIREWFEWWFARSAKK